MQIHKYKETLYTSNGVRYLVACGLKIKDQAKVSRHVGSVTCERCERALRRKRKQ